MNVLQKNQELRNALSNCKSSDSITSEEKVFKAIAVSIPRPGDLIREKNPGKAVFGPAYRLPVSILGVKGTRTVILPLLPDSKKKQQFSIDNVKPA